jgi:hypothetical protein
MKKGLIRVMFQNSIREVLGLSLDQAGDYLQDGNGLLNVSCRKPACTFKENTLDSFELLSTNQSAPSNPASFDPEIISKAEASHQQITPCCFKEFLQLRLKGVMKCEKLLICAKTRETISEPLVYQGKKLWD